jgi:hypothetical protein
VQPKLVIKAMNRFQEAVLKVVGFLLGLKGEPKLIYIAFDDAVEPTINDIKKMNEEDEMNRQPQVDKETGE